MIGTLSPTGVAFCIWALCQEHWEALLGSFRSHRKSNSGPRGPWVSQRVASRMKGGAPQTPLLATCVTLDAHCSSASESPHLWSGFLSHLILQLSELGHCHRLCAKKVSIRIGRQNKGQVQGQRKRGRGRERRGLKGLLPDGQMSWGGECRGVPCLTPFLMLQEIWATVPDASQSQPFLSTTGAQGNWERARWAWMSCWKQVLGKRPLPS